MFDKKVLTMMDDWIVIRSIGDIKEVNSQIVTPEGIKESYNKRRTWASTENYVFELAENISDKLKVGDRIMLDPLVKLFRMEETTKIIEEKTGKKFTKEIKNDKGIVIDTKELEKYFIANFKDVLCKVN